MGLEYKSDPADPKKIVIYEDGQARKAVDKALYLKELKKCASWDELMAAEKKLALRQAVLFLSLKSYFSGELKEKLEAKGLSSEAAAEAVQHCQEKGYLDDAQLLSRWIEKELKKGRSRKMIYFKLRHKADEALLRRLLQDAGPSEEEAVQKWLSKHGRKVDWSDPQAKTKLMAKMARSGFSLELVRVAINSL